MVQKTVTSAAIIMAILLTLAGCENMAHDLHKKGGGFSAVKLPVGVITGTVVSGNAGRYAPDAVLGNLDVQLMWNGAAMAFNPDITSAGGGVYLHLYRSAPGRRLYGVGKRGAA